MVFVLLQRPMDPKSQKPSSLFATPFSLWTEYAFKLWGFGNPAARSNASENKVAVAVIPTQDVQPPPPPPKVARAYSDPKRLKPKARTKSKSKRARR